MEKGEANGMQKTEIGSAKVWRQISSDERGKVIGAKPN
jgi:hypothetical protein